MKIRKDDHMASIVDQAVKLADSQGAAAGANVLCRNAVPLDVARHVLLRPAERRQAMRHDLIGTRPGSRRNSLHSVPFSGN